MNTVGWLLLVHQIPPKPPYLRAKVMRRLTQLGAIGLKRSAYLLPVSDATLEDFQWLRREIKDEGGEAWILEGRFVAGPGDEEIRGVFSAARAAEYRTIAAEAHSLLDRVREAGEAGSGNPADADHRRLARRAEAIREIDFFRADGRDEVEALMTALDRLLHAAPHQRTAGALESLQARTWMTRAGVKVDRMASAWLIRRFIDPAATFVFVRPDEAGSHHGVLRFDMFEGEYTHDGSRCTFEVLLDASGRSADPGLAAIAQIVHDLDLRDARYQRPETSGVGALVNGIVARTDDDARRLAESGPLFDALYAALAEASGPPQADPTVPDAR